MIIGVSDNSSLKTVAFLLLLGGRGCSYKHPGLLHQIQAWIKYGQDSKWYCQAIYI